MIIGPDLGPICLQSSEQTELVCNELITNGTEQVLKAAPFQCRSMGFLFTL